MTKKIRAVCLYTAAVFFFAASGPAIGAECSGSYTPLPNYRPGSGGACAAIGLNTHQAVCQPGQKYATYCDDSKKGYRTCQSNIPCGRQERPRDDRYDDDRNYDRERYNDHYDDRSGRGRY